MINSMTAFAREATDIDGHAVVIELRSVNHRYLDCHFKLPDSVRALEPALREQLSRQLARGKVDCMLRIQDNAASSSGLDINRPLLAAILAACAEIGEQLPGAAPPDPVALLAFPGVSRSASLPAKALEDAVLQLFRRAVAELQAVRAREGEQLARLVLERLAQVEQRLGDLRARMPALLERQQQRLRERIEALGVEIDSARLEQEIVYHAHRADVEEELDRLHTHVGEVRRVMEQGGTCGRRLDFLMQELNREANTLSSKAIAHDMTQTGVELKVLIEQMREQIQNIE